MTTLLAATGNEHKLREMREILEPVGVYIIGAAEAGGIPDVHEDGATFEQNAVKKACEVAAAKNCLVLADDSGLSVPALDGRPGVWSARYAGPQARDTDNVNKLLREMAAVENREASFVCVIAVASCGRLIGTADGAVKGWIVNKPRGNRGFGYDPVFRPEGFTKTFGELPPETKNGLSHRAAALQQALSKGLLSSADGK